MSNRNKSQTGLMIFLLVLLLMAMLLFFLLSTRDTDTEIFAPTVRPTLLTPEQSATATHTATVTATGTASPSPTVTHTVTVTSSPTLLPPTLILDTPAPELPPLPPVVAVNIPAAITGGVRHYGRYGELQDSGHIMVGFPAAGNISSAAFYIDMYEVTNAQLVTYLNASRLTSISLDYWPSEFAKWIDTFKPEAPLKQDDNGNWYVQRGDHSPARWVSALAARAYCANRGGRLPTPEEWKQAALWSEENPLRPFPWGAAPPDKTRAWFGEKEPTTVGQYVEGRSWIGVFDMAGNLAEWVQIDENTFGYIGGSFEDDAATLEKAVQNVTFVDASWALPNVGFRCVK
ncbi:MAG: formylglycine-generating enzyme family protein [Anaerolineae bacterium]|nr:MAG: formylglycine-generating enzyme family protein [Anaerolineae bacterium]